MNLTTLPGNHNRGKFMRLDTAQILKRFFFCEQTLVVGEAGWLPGIPYFDLKTTLPKYIWQDAMVANDMRNRIFELKFPSRVIEVGEDQPLVDLIKFSYHAPNALGFLMVLAEVFKPAFIEAYESYLELADEIADGPSHRFLNQAIADKNEQVGNLNELLNKVIQSEDSEVVGEARQWCEVLKQRFRAVGGIGLTKPSTATFNESASDFIPASKPSRSNEFIPVRFYWPDAVDSTFPYGDGMLLQLRSAVSHLNEVWAVEMAGHVLYSFAKELGWEFIFDASRWVYDESRHCRMGWTRLQQWGFKKEELPLGTYIYDSCEGEDPIYRLGMLFYFETKNIGKKLERANHFESIKDKVSQHDMDFDWADETIHTSYGKKWLSIALENRNIQESDYRSIKEYCQNLVTSVIDTATNDEISQIREIASKVVQRAEFYSKA